MPRTLLLLGLLGAVIAACDRSPAQKVNDEAGQVKEQAKDAGHNVFNGTERTIDRAKDVSKTLTDATEVERHKIDEESE